MSDEHAAQQVRTRAANGYAQRSSGGSTTQPGRPTAPASEWFALLAGEGTAQRVQRVLQLQRTMGNQFVLRQVTTSPGPNDECLDLYGKIIELVLELKRRAQESLIDSQNLQWDNVSKSNPKVVRLPDGTEKNMGSVEGHQEQYEGKQRALRNRISQWDDDDCNQSGKRIAREDREWQFRPFPLPIPRPRPAGPSPADAPGAAPGKRGDAFSSDRIAETLIQVGVPAALVGGMVALIIAALADPEPFSKVALILGSSMAVLFFVLLGQRELIPPDQVAAAGDVGGGGAAVPTETA